MDSSSKKALHYKVVVVSNTDKENCSPYAKPVGRKKQKSSLDENRILRDITKNYSVQKKDVEKEVASGLLANCKRLR